MKEIPAAYVKANQTMLVLLTASSILFQSVVLLAVTFVIACIVLVCGPRFNPAVIVYKSFFRKTPGTETEAASLTRFNQSIAAVLLGTGLLFTAITSHWLAWLPVLAVTLAASAALCGYCIGCVMYYQFNKLKYRAGRMKS
ncbi:DUF4395 domain-containing protein [Alteribacter natronophilus]|uniref:DUF4395 domain-containing protein n=1 Tax=Alteribacter natronophilus TaxID=2583810 RepID=UPI00110D3473|nr:DUF4395 domain-containing protein [Alteribacter natronophilus]TMW73456.1 DUF4395 domain-containing protein [Alteribacter natronophilus]